MSRLWKVLALLDFQDNKLACHSPIHTTKIETQVEMKDLIAHDALEQEAVYFRTLFKYPCEDFLRQNMSLNVK